MSRSVIIWGLPVLYACVMLGGILFAAKYLSVTLTSKDFWAICALISSLFGSVLTAFITLGAVSAKFEADRSLEHIKDSSKRRDSYREMYLKISGEIETLYSCISKLQGGEWNSDDYKLKDANVEATYYQADELKAAGLFDPSYLHRFHHRAFFVSGGAEDLKDPNSRRALWRREAPVFETKYSELKEELRRCQETLTV